MLKRLKNSIARKGDVKRKQWRIWGGPWRTGENLGAGQVEEELLELTPELFQANDDNDDHDDEGEGERVALWFPLASAICLLRWRVHLSLHPSLCLQLAPFFPSDWLRKSCRLWRLAQPCNSSSDRPSPWERPVANTALVC